MSVVRFFIEYWRSLAPKKAIQIRLGFFAILVFSIGAGGLNALLLGLTNASINSGETARGLVLGFTALCVAMPLSRFLAEAILNIFLMRVVTDLQVNFCRQVLLAPLRMIEQVGSHRYTAIISQDLKIIAEGLLAIVLISMHLAIIFGCLGYMGWLSWQALVFTVVFIVFGYQTQNWIANKAMRYFRKARQKLDHLYDLWRAFILGNKELKLHRGRRLDLYYNDFLPTVQTFRRERYQGFKFFSAANSYISALYFILLGFLLFGLTFIVAMDRESQTGFALCLLFIFEPLTQVVTRVRSVGHAHVSVDKVRAVGLELSEAGHDAKLDEEQHVELPVWQSLRLKGVKHIYSEAERANRNHFELGPIDLTFRPGEFVIIAGGNGSGKTTFGKLLAGLYVPAEGEILYNDIPITDENRDAYRQLFSALFVDFYLFDQLLGLNPDDLDERARAYLEKLDIAHKVQIEDGRFSTTALSQGQRKRLALLIAYLEDRPFYIFDEWTANQDPRFRRIFYEEVVPDLLARGKTVVMITHDDQYFDRADRFLKLDYGRLVEGAKAKEVVPNWGTSKHERTEATQDGIG